MCAASDAIRRLTKGWQRRLDYAEWGIIADAYADLGDDKNAELWHRRRKWWGNLATLCVQADDTAVGKTWMIRVGPFEVYMRRCKASLKVSVRLGDGSYPPKPACSYQGVLWRLASVNPRYLLERIGELLVILENACAAAEERNRSLYHGERT